MDAIKEALSHAMAKLDDALAAADANAAKLYAHVVKAIHELL